jgi:hypothetical protein
MVVAYFDAAPDLPPLVSAVVPSRDTLWPPNKGMVPIRVMVSVTDDVDASVACRVTCVTSNEALPADYRSPARFRWNCGPIGLAGAAAAST